MAWISANKDMISIFIALLAIVVSLSTALINLRNLRTSSFIAIQKEMLNGEMQRGRLLVYGAIATGYTPPRDSDEEYLMVRSLAVFDQLALLSRLRIIPRSWVLRFWHARLQWLQHGFGIQPDDNRPYILQGRPNLQYLIDLAVRYRCTDSCCADGRKEVRRRGPARAQRAPQPNPPEETSRRPDTRPMINKCRWFDWEVPS